MKKLFSLAAAILIAVSAFGADRAHTLKVYNWADYIDIDNVLNTFPAWYKAQTGEDVEIIYNTFDINESMLTEIEVGKEDYDVICPSEYIIERMLRNNLLQKIDKNFGETPDYTVHVAPFAVEKFQQMAPAGSNINVADYTVGYMWGTTGILYNPALVDEADIRSWGGLLNEKYKGKILMKDAFRDIYSVVVLYCFREDVAAGRVTRDDLVANITPERIDSVRNFLMRMKDNISGWEVDFGKEEMTKGKSYMDVMWSGDAQWAIDEAAETGVELKYIIPEEGTNVWFDGWCIPVYAQNTKAASYFINYLCMPENAILNMEEIGYVSVIASPEILEWADNNDPEDENYIAQTANLSYFFGENAEAIHANQVFYPDQAVIDRGALMHDCDVQTKAMLEMWNEVKGDNLGMGMVIFIVVIALMAIAFIAMQFVNSRNRKKQRRLRK